MATTLAIVGLGLGIFKATQQRQEAEAQAQAEEFNIGVARQEQKISIASRKLEKVREQKAGRAFLSRQQALTAKSGVTLSGSPLDVMRDTAEELELDILIGDINASIEQSRLESEVGIRGIQAEEIRRAGKIRAGTTLLATGLEFAGKFLIPR